MQTNKLTFFLLLIAIAIVACEKTSSPDLSPPNNIDDTPFQLSYGDSIIYLKEQSSDYIITPVQRKSGTYTSFPEGMEIDEKTGAINVSKSEMGLRYRITHKATDGTTTSTVILLSGINYTDKYYFLSKGDSIALPVYNADVNKGLPCNNDDCSFDEDGTAKTTGCDIKTVNGHINLAQSVRNGFFGATPANDKRIDVDIAYRLNDKSNKAKNNIRVRLYYYDTMNDIPDEIKDILQSREGMVFRMQNENMTSTARLAGKAKEASRPRPPCVIVIAHNTSESS